MKYNITRLQDEFEKEKRLKFLFFWGHTARKENLVDQSCLSQWWPCIFNHDNVGYFSAEHYMMAEKARLFNDLSTLEKILGSRSPALAKKVGREVQNFDQEKWEQNRFEIVKRGNFLKFDQNKGLKNYLLSTNNRILVEASPVDALWGIGLAKDDPQAQNPFQWKGLNLLGFALMEVRDMLNNEN